MNFRRSLFFAAFLWLGFSAHGAQAEANIAPPVRNWEPAVQCDFTRTDRPLPKVTERARPATRGAQAQNPTSGPTPSFERVPDSWRDLRPARQLSSFFVAAAPAPLLPSAYIVRSGLSPPSA